MILPIGIDKDGVVTINKVPTFYRVRSLDGGKTKTIYRITRGHSLYYMQGEEAYEFLDVIMWDCSDWSNEALLAYLRLRIATFLSQGV